MPDHKEELYKQWMAKHGPEIRKDKDVRAEADAQKKQAQAGQLYSQALDEWEAAARDKENPERKRKALGMLYQARQIGGSSDVIDHAIQNLSNELTSQSGYIPSEVHPVVGKDIQARQVEGQAWLDKTKGAPTMGDQYEAKQEDMARAKAVREQAISPVKPPGQFPEPHPDDHESIKAAVQATAEALKQQGVEEHNAVQMAVAMVRHQLGH